MALVVRLAAHGGTAGLIVESVVAGGVIALALAIWLGQRKQRRLEREGAGREPPPPR